LTCVDQRQPEGGGRSDRDGRVHAAYLGARDVRDGSPQMDAERLDRFDDLGETRELLDHDGRRAHHRHEQDEGVIGHLVQADDRDVAGGQRLAGEERTDVRVSSAAGAENGGAASESFDVCGGDGPAHVTPPCPGRRRL
jgi:hypothetical protein